MNAITDLKPYFEQLSSNETAALDLVEDIRWAEEPHCPYCGSKRIYRLDVKSVQRRRLKCGCCRRQFTVTKGTILEGSRVPLGKWVQAMAILCEADHPVTVSELMREIGVSYRAAQNIFERIRYASRNGPLSSAVYQEGL